MPALILDTDPGVDDAFAIAAAALSRDTELLAVTTVFGNVPLAATTGNAQRLLALCGREDVPVAAGASRPLVYPHPHRGRYAHGSDGLSGYASTLPEPARAPVDRGAVELMAGLLSTTAEPVTIAAIGPLTNVALLLACHPGLRERIDRLVVMGGAAIGGNVTPSAEFNIWSDPEAARRVLVEEDVPVTLVPLDLTYCCAVDATWLEALLGSGRIGAALHGLTPDYREYYRDALGFDGLVLHDSVAVAEVLRPGLLRTEEMPVEVECALGPSRGMTVLDRRSPKVREELDAPPRTIDVAMDTDLPGLREFVLSSLTVAAAP